MRIRFALITVAASWLWSASPLLATELEQTDVPSTASQSKVLDQALDDICGTFGASYSSPGSWTLFLKRAGRFSSPKMSLCMDNDCGQAQLIDGYFQREVHAKLGNSYTLSAKPGARSRSFMISVPVSLTMKSCPMGSPAFAPDSTAGLDIVLSIEKAESTSLPGGFPTMGAVLQAYAADGTYHYHGAGGPNQLTGKGTYTYTKTGRNTGSEDAVQYSDFFVLPYHMDYTFERPDSGHWIQYFAGGLIVFQGSFATSPTNTTTQWAPTSFDHANIMLATESSNLCELQITHIIYSAGGYSSRTLVAPAVTESGTYTLEKLSARNVVEEGTNEAGSKYVRVYTFTGERIGYWQEANVADDSRKHGWFRYGN